MAAADSFVGEGLSPSPYAEAMEQIEEQARLISLYERVIQTKDGQLAGLTTRLRDKGLELLDAKRSANKLARKVEMLERDNAWLREILTNVTRQP